VAFHATVHDDRVRRVATRLRNRPDRHRSPARVRWASSRNIPTIPAGWPVLRHFGHARFCCCLIRTGHVPLVLTLEAFAVVTARGLELRFGSHVPAFRALLLHGLVPDDKVALGIVLASVE